VRLRFVTVSLLCVCAGSPARAQPVTEIHYTMGTYFSIQIDGMAEPEARAVMRRCFGEARRLESVFSRFDPNSELNHLNASKSATVMLSADVADLLRRSLALREATRGAFDVTIGALTALWRGSPQLPTGEEIRSAGGGDAGGRVHLQDRELIRLRPGVQLDFDGVAKGYAVDRCVSLLRATGVTRALVSLGESSQYALGTPEGLKGWKIVVRGNAPESAIGTVRLRDRALSVSAVFGHSRKLAGDRIGHIIDPTTGRPLQTNALVLVAADNATDAEAYSKAVLIRGLTTVEAADAAARRPRSLAAVVRVDDRGIQSWRAETIGFRAYRHAHRLSPREEPLS
jgi:FAD:protein FMN transferase